MADTRIITTGGTIDKQYMPATGSMGFMSYMESDLDGVRIGSESHLYSMMYQAGCTIPYTNQLLFMKDSRELTDDDRQTIKNACLDAPERRIIILHGTDTMIETAQCLDSIQGKCIVLTGAFIPWSCQNSDAMFNLGTAFAYSQMMPNGVYIAMNGRIFQWDMVRKNPSCSIFEMI